MEIHRRHFSYLISALALGLYPKDLTAKSIGEDPDDNESKPSDSNRYSRRGGERGDTLDRVSLADRNSDELGTESRAPVCEGKDMSELQMAATGTRRAPKHLAVGAGEYCKEEFSSALSYDSQSLIDKTIANLQAVREPNNTVPQRIRDSEFACTGFTNIDFSSAGICVTGNDKVITYKGFSSSPGPEIIVGVAYPNALAYLEGESYSATNPIGGVGLSVGVNSDSVAVMLQFSFTRALAPSASATYGEPQNNIRATFKEVVRDLENGTKRRQ